VIGGTRQVGLDLHCPIEVVELGEFGDASIRLWRVVGGHGGHSGSRGSWGKGQHRGEGQRDIGRSERMTVASTLGLRSEMLAHNL
jgi:hypothetical protein